ncbi:MAG: putative colanic acid biosynthesis acetyltransferase [Verrucomicrobia bacterium]|nr:putative colanic acid biosynthesis acetyltransferase [Verrucomicrobiota bacterium]MBT7066532.1 putative colanic acid biosynthesis acetyltransferase [Verrucomicrobiota bacterium]MBT7700053.1 putative colanic acid biosynthesis acetyltransferase [Verrucomicrobiota bacterium]
MTDSQRERWPYSPVTYVRRALWRLVWLSLWKVAHWRLTGVRSAILRAFGARVGRGTALRASTWIEMPWQLALGERCLLGDHVRIYNLGPLSIGDDSVISQNAHLCGGTHDYTDPTFALKREEIRIGKQAWIAADAFVGPGVTIGDGAIVGARAVAIGDVAPWTIVGGNPAQPIKQRPRVGPAT